MGHNTGKLYNNITNRNKKEMLNIQRFPEVQFKLLRCL